MFMINDYHMAVINDNDFGLEGNTHVQVYVQLITYVTAHVVLMYNIRLATAHVIH